MVVSPSSEQAKKRTDWNQVLCMILLKARKTEDCKEHLPRFGRELSPQEMNFAQQPDLVRRIVETTTI